MSSSSDRYVPNSNVLFTALDDGEGVLLDLITREYYTLNDSARQIWQLIAEGLEYEHVVAQLTDHFTLSEDEAREVVTVYISELLEQGLIQKTDETRSQSA